MDDRELAERLDNIQKATNAIFLEIYKKKEEEETKEKKREKTKLTNDENQKIEPKKTRFKPKED